MRNNETMSKQSASNTNPNICTWCKDHIIYIAIALIACISMTSCNWFSGKSSDKLISFADSLIYGYYCSEDTMLLHYALKIYNETDSNKIDSRIAYTKLTVLFLLKHYSQGEEFVRSLDENIFFKPYHKKMYLDSFRALQYEENGDSIKSTNIYRKTASNIQTYFDKTEDVDALLDLYAIKRKFETQKSILEEIDRMIDKQENLHREFISLKYMQKIHYNPFTYLDEQSFMF